MKGQYTWYYRLFTSNITDAINDLRKQNHAINREIQSLDNKLTTPQAIEDFFDEYVKEPFANSIAGNEISIRDSGVRRIFENHQDELFGIRNKDPIRSYIKRMIGFLPDFIEFYNIKDEILVRKKEELLRKYNLYNGDLEVIRDEVHKQKLNP